MIHPPFKTLNQRYNYLNLQLGRLVLIRNEDHPIFAYVHCSRASPQGIEWKFMFDIDASVRALNLDYRVK